MHFVDCRCTFWETTAVVLAWLQTLNNEHVVHNIWMYVKKVPNSWIEMAWDSKRPVWGFRNYRCLEILLNLIAKQAVKFILLETSSVL